MTTKEFISWMQVEDFVNQIVTRYKDTKISGVYGLPRGGLVLAVMVSHRLHVPMLNAPCENCIVIDDICDSGESLLHYSKNSSSFDKPLYHIITMYYKENTLHIVPEMYGYTKTDSWIVFPWEEKEE